MKLYKIPGAPAGERFHSAKTGLKDFIELELPKDGRAGMAKFLNDNEAELVGVGILPPKQLDPLEEAELRAVAAAGGSTTVPSNEPRSVTRHDIEEFLLERATVADAEAIFGCLGNLFKEAINGQRSR